MIDKAFSVETYKKIEEFDRIIHLGVCRAQEESRRLGVPNVYSINGKIYYELPNGELSLEDPYLESKRPD